MVVVTSSLAISTIMVLFSHQNYCVDIVCCSPSNKKGSCNKYYNWSNSLSADSLCESLLVTLMTSAPIASIWSNSVSADSLY